MGAAEGARPGGSCAGQGHTPSSVILVESLERAPAPLPPTFWELCSGHLGCSFLISKMGTNTKNGLV